MCETVLMLRHFTYSSHLSALSLHCFRFPLSSISPPSSPISLSLSLSLPLPPPSLLHGVAEEAVGYSGLQHSSSFSKKSAVEAHESRLKDALRLTRGSASTHTHAYTQAKWDPRGGPKSSSFTLFLSTQLSYKMTPLEQNSRNPPSCGCGFEGCHCL